MTATSGAPSATPASSPAAGVETATVRIPSVQILPQSQPTLNVGDLLRFYVRANPEGGPGTLYFQGQLLKTQLPPSIQTGDRLLARLEQSGEQVVFKILEHIKAKNNSLVPFTSTANSSALFTQTAQGLTPFEHLVRKVETLINHTSTILPRSFEGANETLAQARTPIYLPQFTDATQIKERLEQFLSAIGSADSFTDAKAVSRSLSSVMQGNVANSMRETAEAIRSFIEDNRSALAAGDRFIAVLQQEISKLLDGMLRGLQTEPGAKQVDNLIRVLNEELRQNRHRGESERSNLLKLTLTEIKLAREHPQHATQYLESAIERLFQYQSPMEQQELPRLDSKSFAELQQLAGRLESLATAQETLNQLNPLMQALGEPALILFPFIFQNMLRHSELSIRPERKKKEGDGKSSGEDSTYQRLVLSVPLPALGEIDVEIAYRDEEIKLRFNVSDEKVAMFLNEREEDLRGALSAAGLSLTEFQAENALQLESGYEKTPARKADGGIVA